MDTIRFKIFPPDTDHLNDTDAAFERGSYESRISTRTAPPAKQWLSRLVAERLSYDRGSKEFYYIAFSRNGEAWKVMKVRFEMEEVER